MPQKDNRSKSKLTLWKEAPERTSFTLVEVLTAMAVFVILMGIMFQFVGGAQQVWSLSKSNARVYENARVSLDVISRDLQSAIASEDIPFKAEENAEGALQTFVTATNLNPRDEASKMTLVQYNGKISADGNDTVGLERPIVSLTNSNLDDADWIISGLGAERGTVSSVPASDELTDTDKNWNLNQHEDHTVRLISGNAVGEQRVITANNGDTLTLASDWSISPSNGDDYMILDRPDWIISGLAAVRGSVSSVPASNKLQDTSKNWNPDEHVGRTVIIRRSGKNERRIITGNTTDTLTVASNWTTSPSGNNYIIPKFSIRCYDENGNAAGSNDNVLPGYARISLTLVDPKLVEQGMPQSEIDKTKRTFNKTVYFRGKE